jgi:hypothetical protein
VFALLLLHGLGSENNNNYNFIVNNDQYDFIVDQGTLSIRDCETPFNPALTGGGGVGFEASASS